MGVRPRGLDALALWWREHLWWRWWGRRCHAAIAVRQTVAACEAAVRPGLEGRAGTCRDQRQGSVAPRHLILLRGAVKVLQVEVAHRALPLTVPFEIADDRIALAAIHAQPNRPRSVVLVSPNRWFWFAKEVLVVVRDVHAGLRCVRGGTIHGLLQRALQGG